ncbi:cell division protein FtsA [Sporosarcina koreensis]|uniref:Cell division protein FtsA n=1 Tax=Sporosarcina koreensis TaxID=334735 RepID=A0ABW0U1H5_9BACL
MSNKLFALDIGTRSVVGIILSEQDGSYHVADLVTIEHKERSMIDGQIHNIVSVASVISEIKSILEERHGMLKKVSVAAAGRALKTMEGSMTIDIAGKPLFTPEDINRLELAAVQQAQQQLLSSAATADDYYYCVGYSVLHYKLDEDEIGSLIDQAGRTATAEVIATFLPRVVVESLLSALKRAGLEMEALTLEPIAAINVLIPPSMRRLNVALVDIGAGTSDIAITNNNTVVSYGMVPVAGDEITEALSNHYLLDFPVAEIAKRSLATEESITISDILGFEQQVPTSEVTAIIKPSIEKLASSIADEIKRLNQKSPQAVMVVGGGSLTPLLPKELSIRLDLPENRVGIRGLDALSEVTLSEGIFSTPALVTPIGIAIAARRAPIHYMSVTVNEKTIRLFELKEMTVGDALLAANIKARQLYGKPGMGISITLNGGRMMIPGEHGISSEILLNRKPASTKDFIMNGDEITLEPGKDGKDASVTIRDLIGEIQPIKVTIHGNKHTIVPSIECNGIPVGPDTLVEDRDEIVFSQSTKLNEVLEDLGMEPYIPFEVFVNNKRIRLDDWTPQFFIGNMPVPQDHPLRDGDEIKLGVHTPPTVGDIVATLDHSDQPTASITFNGEPVTIWSSGASILLNGEQVDNSAIVRPGDRLTIPKTAQRPFLFSDVFLFIDYSLPKNASSSYQLLRNGEPIGFNDSIFSGDALEIKFS